MRRAEMARRRKNLSEKRNEEEKVYAPALRPPLLSRKLILSSKMDTINRLLKKQAPKRRGRAPGLATTAADTNMADAGGASAGADAQNNAATSTSDTAAAATAIDTEMGSAIYVRWVNSKKGSVLAVPHEWLDAPAGRVFKTDKLGAPVAKAST